MLEKEKIWQKRWDEVNKDQLKIDQKVWVDDWKFNIIPGIIRKANHPYYEVRLANGEIREQLAISEIKTLDEFMEEFGYDQLREWVKYE